MREAAAKKAKTATSLAGRESNRGVPRVLLTLVDDLLKQIRKRDVDIVMAATRRGRLRYDVGQSAGMCCSIVG